MKSPAWVLVLVACAGSPAQEPEYVSAPALDCPSCPTCDKAPCPTCPACPTCAECPKPPEPTAVDWHCMSLDLPTRGLATFCWPSASVCEGYRQKALNKPKNWGKPSACTTQQAAFCFYLGDANPMSRQTSCARTLEDCDKRRQLTREQQQQSGKTGKVSSCTSMLNTDTFDYDDDGNALNYLP